MLKCFNVLMFRNLNFLCYTMAAEYEEMRRVEPSNMDYDAQQDSDDFPDHVMAAAHADEGRALSFISEMRAKSLYFDTCLMMLGLVIFVSVALFAFVVSLPMMIWISTGYCLRLFHIETIEHCRCCFCKGGARWFRQRSSVSVCAIRAPRPSIIC